MSNPFRSTSSDVDILPLALSRNSHCSRRISLAWVKDRWLNEEGSPPAIRPGKDAAMGSVAGVAMVAEVWSPGITRPASLDCKGSSRGLGDGVAPAEGCSRVG